MRGTCRGGSPCFRIEDAPISFHFARGCSLCTTRCWGPTLCSHVSTLTLWACCGLGWHLEPGASWGLLLCPMLVRSQRRRRRWFNGAACRGAWRQQRAGSTLGRRSLCQPRNQGLQRGRGGGKSWRKASSKWRIRWLEACDRKGWAEPCSGLRRGRGSKLRRFRRCRLMGPDRSGPCRHYGPGSGFRRRGRCCEGHGRPHRGPTGGQNAENNVRRHGYRRLRSVAARRGAWRCRQAVWAHG